ncbi:MAG TPA: asparagine synthase (glutamine-hydrolyzing) [Verrucomicrobiales bacterium]|nr:asparagine synthase (glutamine-hydrolyzing) [Verrucomicrobiales bacterium]
MCGIAGIFQSEPAPMKAALEKLRAALRHRGPDDEGQWLSPCGMAGLAHTRLAVLDLSPAGHQPMITADGRFAIVFNGEIYNFRELRAELEGAGAEFRTRSDTEVLLRLYEREGAPMVRCLRGMFALAIWDEAERTAFLARDPFGIKPLYYSHQAGRLAFASEVRALQSAGLADSSLDAAAMMRYLESGSVAEPATLLKEVRALPAGHSMIWKAGAPRMECHWRPVFSPGPMSAAEAAEKTRAALLDSLDHHFVSDVPVGLFLSGGVDSTLLAVLAREQGRAGLESFSIGVDDARLDESSVAARTAAHLGLRHHELRLNAAGMAESFPRFLRHMDQPGIDGFNTFMVSGFARAQGMKVVLSGLGGDEIFGGYASFEKVPRLAHATSWLRRLPGSVPLGRWMEHSMPRANLRRAGDLLQRGPGMTEAWRVFRGIFPRAQARRLTALYSGCDEASLTPEPALAADTLDERDQVSLLEMTLYMRNQLLKDSDVMSMAHGLELRVPLVDRALFESVASIPADLRLRAGKQLLLDAVPGIPDWVAGQPKRGFLFPYEKWLAADWGGAFQQARADIRDPRAPWYQQWCVFMLRQWLEKNAAS